MFIFTYGEAVGLSVVVCWQTLRGGSIEIINESVIDFGSGGVNGPERGGEHWTINKFWERWRKGDRNKATLKSLMN